MRDQADSAPAGERVAARSVLPLAAGQLFLHACMAGARMAAPLLVLRQGHGALAVGLMLAMFAITSVALALPAGRLTDRYGLHRPFMWGAALATTGAALGAVMQQYWALALGALLIGGGLNMGMIAVQRRAGRLARNPVELRQVFSWMALAPSLSNFAGPFLAGLVIDYAGFGAALGVLAVLPVIGIWLIRRVHDGVGQGVGQGAGHETSLTPEVTGEEGAPVSRRAWDLLERPGLKRLLLINGLLSMGWDVHTFVVPVLGHEHAFSATTIGAILGTFALAATSVRLAIPQLAHRLQERQVLSAAMALTALVLGIYPLMPNAVAMGICSALLGLALGSVQPMVMSVLHQLTPHHRHGEALGLRIAVINATSSVVPVLFGFMGGVVGVASVFWMTATAELAGSRLAATIDRFLPEIKS